MEKQRKEQKKITLSTNMSWAHFTGLVRKKEIKEKKFVKKRKKKEKMEKINGKR